MSFITFNGASFMPLSDRGVGGDWVAPAIVDEQNLIGRQATDVNVLGYGSEEISFTALVVDRVELGKLKAQNGKRGTITLRGDTRNVMLTFNAGDVTLFPAGHAKVQCRLKVC